MTLFPRFSLSDNLVYQTLILGSKKRFLNAPRLFLVEKLWFVVAKSFVLFSICKVTINYSNDF